MGEDRRKESAWSLGSHALTANAQNLKHTSNDQWGNVMTSGKDAERLGSEVGRKRLLISEKMAE